MKAQPLGIARQDRRHFIRGSKARIIMGDDEPGALRLRQEIRAEVERRDLSSNYIARLGIAPEDSNRRWYAAITGQKAVGWHVAAVCYATAAIFLGFWPWNFLLLLLLFPIRNQRVRFYAFRTLAAKESMRSRDSYRRGSPI
jgi:hypothetical protein